MEDLTYTVNDEETKLLDTVSKDDIYMKGDRVIINLKGIKALAKEEGIVEKKIETVVTPNESNLQQHVVNIWVGFIGDDDPDTWERASGEANRLNTGRVDSLKKVYVERGEVDSMYRYAMADKRAYTRAVLKLVGLFGVSSSVESKDFEVDAVSDDDSVGDYNY